MSVTLPISVLVLLIYVLGMFIGRLRAEPVALDGARRHAAALSVADLVISRFFNKLERPHMSNFWDLIQLLLSTFVLIVYLLILFQIIGDLFRDSEMGGGAKVLWIIGLVVIPGLTAILYIVIRGRGMAERQRASLQRAKSDTDAYIREVAGKSPAEHIADAKALLDAGTHHQEEFAQAQGQGPGLSGAPRASRAGPRAPAAAAAAAAARSWRRSGLRFDALVVVLVRAAPTQRASPCVSSRSA